MKNILLVCAAFVLACSPGLAQQGQMPITTTSPDALALYQKALDCAENVELEAARPLLDQAIQKDPGFALAYALRSSSGGGFQVSRESREKAVNLADKVSPGERHLIMAMQARADGNVPKTRQHLADMLKLHPSDKHAIFFAAITHWSMGEDDEALALLQRATTIDPAFAAAYNQMGYLHLRKGNVAGAEQALKQYIATRPDSPNPYDSYAELLLRQGRYDESIVQYEKALTKAPTFSGSMEGLGHNYVFKGDHAKARASYARLYDTGTPTNQVSSLYWKAVSFVHEGKTAEALEALEQQRALAATQGLAPAALGALLDQAWLLSESGRAVDARGHIDRMEAMIGTAPFTEAQKANWRRQVVMARALAAAHAKDFAAARSQLGHLKAAITPDLPIQWTQTYEATAGIVDVLEGHHDAALPHLKQADPEDVYAMFYQAEALRLKGDAAAAAAMYSKVAKSNINGIGYALVRSRAIKRAQT